MTREQAQSLVEHLNDAHHLLSNTITSLVITLEIFDQLLPEDKDWLQAYWQQQQLMALHLLSTPIGEQLSLSISQRS